MILFLNQEKIYMKKKVFSRYKVEFGNGSEDPAPYQNEAYPQHSGFWRALYDIYVFLQCADLISI